MFCKMFSGSSTGSWAVLQLPFFPKKQGELSENILQNRFHNLTKVAAAIEIGSTQPPYLLLRGPCDMFWGLVFGCRPHWNQVKATLNLTPQTSNLINLPDAWGTARPLGSATADSSGATNAAAATIPRARGTSRTTSTATQSASETPLRFRVNSNDQS